MEKGRTSELWDEPSHGSLVDVTELTERTLGKDLGHVSKYLGPDHTEQRHL